MEYGWTWESYTKSVDKIKKKNRKSISNFVHCFDYLNDKETDYLCTHLRKLNIKHHVTNKSVYMEIWLKGKITNFIIKRDP